MKTRYLVVVILLFAQGLFFSCKKSEQKDKEKALNFTDIVRKYISSSESSKKTGEIFFSNQDASWVKNEIPDIFISGSFFDKPGGVLTANKLFNVNNIQIPFNGFEKFPGYFMQSLGNKSSSIEWMKSIWGTNVKIEIESKNGTGAFKLNAIQGDFYIPDGIEMNAPFNESFVVNTAINNTISWTPDPENPIETVFIGIVYEGILASQFDPNLPSVNNLVLFLEVPDNGQLRITPEQLSSLPTGGRASIYLARANYKTFTDPSTGEETLVSAINYSTSGPVGTRNME